MMHNYGMNMYIKNTSNKTAMLQLDDYLLLKLNSTVIN